MTPLQSQIVSGHGRGFGKTSALSMANPPKSPSTRRRRSWPLRFWSIGYERRSCGRTVPPTARNLHNPFIFDILARSIGVDGKEKKILKRALLDRGSDVNLVSAGTYEDIGTILKPSRHDIHTLAGTTSIVGETIVGWSFMSAEPTKVLTSLHRDKFYVLGHTENAAFDIILGHQ